jgi:hypothetical protein
VLRKRRLFRGFRTIAVGSALGLICAIPGLVRYALKGDLRLVGTLRGKGSLLPVLVLENRRFGEGENQRLYAPPGMRPVDILKLLGDVEYVLPRWTQPVLRGDPMRDLDILVGDCDIERVQAIFRRRLGLFPVDVYTASGCNGHAFKSAPYYVPHVARRLLAGAKSGQHGVKHLESDLAYLAFSYHLLFHKTDSVRQGTEALADSGWEPQRLGELARLADASGRRRPLTFRDIEHDLDVDGMMPPLDTIGFYCRRNAFLTARYNRARIPAGLSVMLVRDFQIRPEPLADIRRMIVNGGFEILLEDKIDPISDKRAIEAIRGGNWHDRHAPARMAHPRYYLVCRSLQPQPPTRSTLRRYPHLDDERLLLKRKIRDEFSRRQGIKTNIIHVSDNSTEAWEYARALGVANIVADRLNVTAPVHARKATPTS